MIFCGLEAKENLEGCSLVSVLGFMEGKKIEVFLKMQNGWIKQSNPFVSVL